MLDELGSAGRDHLGLALGLGANLRVHALSEADAQGNPEGDQGEQQHVRHRKRESEPEAYWEPS